MSDDRQRRDLEHIFVEHRTSLREVAQRIVGTRDHAEDVIHTAYLRIVDLSARLIIRQPLRYWFQVVRHLAIDYRRRMRHEARVFVDEVEGYAAASPRSSPEQLAISAECLSQVEQVLVRLPDRTRLAFNLYRLDGLTQREIASRLGVSPTLVNFMIRDAVNALKRCRQHFEHE